jgi:predicted permease
MGAVVAALLPVFLLIVLGFVLRRRMFPAPEFWSGLERLVYYVLFPALLIDTLARAKFGSVPLAGVGGALALAVVVISALCLALRPLLARRLAVDGPAFTSLFQGATRWQTFVALSVCGNLYGDNGVALASVAMVAMIPLLNILAVWVLTTYAREEKLNLRKLFGALIRNPLLVDSAIGIALNLAGIPLPGWVHEFLDSLGRCSLAIGLLVIGAGLQFETLRRPLPVAWLTVALKLIVMPVVAIGLALAFRLSGPALAVVAICSAVPSASNGYILARQMGGDAPLLAQILVMQTLLAMATMPLFIAWTFLT